MCNMEKNLFAFNTKLLSKRCGLIDENGNLLKAARVPKKLSIISKIINL